MKCHMCKHEWDNINITRCPNCDSNKDKNPKVRKGLIGTYDIGNKKEDKSRMNSESNSKSDREKWEEHIKKFESEDFASKVKRIRDSDSESIPNENQDRNPNENQIQILNQFLNQFRNKFGIDSVKKVADFAEKYPQLFYGILGGIVMQYLSENPGISEDIFKRFLEIMEAEF